MQSPIRQVANLNPITDAYSGNMACGASAAASAKTIANVTAGSNVQFTWTAGPSQKWPHRYGCVLCGALVLCCGILTQLSLGMPLSQ